MRKYRILYGIILFTSLILFIFSNRLAAGAFFTGLAVLLLSSAIWNWYNASQMEVALELKPGAERGQECILYINMKNASRFASGAVRIELVWNNIWLGEVYKDEVLCPSHHIIQERQEVHFKSRYCGKLVCSAVGITIYDLFGITGCRLRNEQNKICMIFPGQRRIQTDESTRMSGWKEPETYSVYQRGDDRSEWYAVHEYIPGDSVKSIHWKLSAKLQDELLVREYKQLLDQDVLVLVDFFREYQGAKISNACLDGALMVAAAIAYSLEEQLKFHLGWYDTVTKRCRMKKIIKNEDILEALQEMLSLPVAEKGPFAAWHYLYELEKKPFKKVYYVACESTEEILEPLHAMQETKTILVREQEALYTKTKYGISISVKQLEEGVDRIVI